MGVYANDDTYGLHALLPAGHALTPTVAGIYYLVVTRFNLDPSNPGGLIFPNLPYAGVFGPTGPGGGSPIAGYTGSTAAGGAYTITLTGAVFASAIPEPVSSLLVGCGLIGLGLLYRRRR